MSDCTVKPRLAGLPATPEGFVRKTGQLLLQMHASVAAHLKCGGQMEVCPKVGILLLATNCRWWQVAARQMQPQQMLSVSAAQKVIHLGPIL